MDFVVLEIMQINDTFIHLGIMIRRLEASLRVVLRAGINLSNFLLVTGKDDQVILMTMMTMMMMIVKIMMLMSWDQPQ